MIRVFSQLNEDIKAIVRTSRRMVLMSFNAMFTSRHAGGRAAGYAHVTTELRRFSRELDEDMQRLQKRVDLAVVRASELQRQIRFSELTVQAGQLSEQRWTNVTKQLQSVGRGRLSKREQQLRETQSEVVRGINRALRTGLKGENLAVLAKVEASHADGVGNQRLSQVSDEVAEIVIDINQRLQASRSRIESAVHRGFHEDR